MGIVFMQNFTKYLPAVIKFIMCTLVPAIDFENF